MGAGDNANAAVRSPRTDGLTHILNIQTIVSSVFLAPSGAQGVTISVRPFSEKFFQALNFHHSGSNLKGSLPALPRHSHTSRTNLLALSQLCTSSCF